MKLAQCPKGKLLNDINTLVNFLENATRPRTWSKYYNRSFFFRYLSARNLSGRCAIHTSICFGLSYSHSHTTTRRLGQKITGKRGWHEHHPRHEPSTELGKRGVGGREQKSLALDPGIERHARAVLSSRDKQLVHLTVQVRELL